MARSHRRLNLNPDHARRINAPHPSDSEIEAKLNELVKPAVFAELDHYRQLGLRNRLLNLPVMTALVLSLIWRRIPGVCTLQRMLARERLLWCTPRRVSQAALSERFLCFPAQLFERVLYAVIAALPERSAQRRRPLPRPLAALQGRFPRIYALDGSTLEALFRKLKSLQAPAGAAGPALAGQIQAVVEITTHVPVRLFFSDEAKRNDKLFLPEVLAWMVPQTMLVFDLGYFSFDFFDALTERGAYFVTRLREKISFRVEAVLVETPQLRQRIVHLGCYRSNPSQHSVRLVEVYIEGHWRAYLTNILEPERLSAAEIVALYERRWKIERMFLEVKRLLGLAYLWVGSLNGICLQLYATFLFYAVLIDLCDEVAEEAGVALERVSVEMVYRGLYFYVGARAQGYAGSAAQYFVEQGKDLGVFKRTRNRGRPGAYAQARAAERAGPAGGCADAL